MGSSSVEHEVTNIKIKGKWVLVVRLKEKAEGVFGSNLSCKQLTAGDTEQYLLYLSAGGT